MHPFVLFFNFNGCLTDGCTLGQIVFVAAYSMYFRANTTTTYPLATQNAKNEVIELGIM